MVEAIDQIDFIVTETEAEALLAEQNFIKRYRPRLQRPAARRQVVPVHRDLAGRGLPARLLHAREAPPRARLLRAVLERQARARDARPARQGLPVPHLRGHRARPRRRAAPAWTTSSSAARRPASATSPRRSTAGTSTRSSPSCPAATARSSASWSSRCRRLADAQEFEQAALYRNRLKSVRSLLERQRISNEAVGTLDAIAVAVEDTDANAQVFQVRDGVLADRQSFYLENEAGRDEGEVAEEFVLQYYASALAIPPQVIVPRGLADVRRCWRRRSPSAAAGRSRSATPSAATSGASSSWPSATRGWRSTRTGCGPSAAAPSGSRRWTASSGSWAWTCSRCGSSASTSRTWARPTRSPRWSCSRAARRRSPTTAASGSAAPRRTTSPRWPRCCRGGWPSTCSSASARRTSAPTTPASRPCRR